MSSPRRSRRLSQSRSGAGSITPFVTILCVALVALLGLVADGGRALSARQAALTEAEQAARAGADQLSVGALRAGSATVDSAAAVATAEDDMAASGHPGTATVRGTVVTASVTAYQLATPLLSLIGVGSLEIAATASATPVAG